MKHSANSCCHFELKQKWILPIHKEYKCISRNVRLHCTSQPRDKLRCSKELNIPKGLWLGSVADTGSHTSHREVVAWPVGPGCSDLLAKSALQTLTTGVCVTLVSFLCLCGEEPAGNVSGSGSCAVWRKAHWPSFLSCLSHLKDCAHVRSFLSMFASLSPKIRAGQTLVCGRCGLALWHTASLLISTGLWIPQSRDSLLIHLWADSPERWKDLLEITGRALKSAWFS